MSCLVCRMHKRRVMVLPTTTVVHRQDGGVCSTDTVLIKDGKGKARVFSPGEVVDFVHHQVLAVESNPG